MTFKSFPTIPLSQTTKFIVDNRGKTAPTASGGIPLIATNCIDNGQLYPIYNNVRYVSQETYQDWFRSHPEPNDIILTLKGSQNGAACLVPKPVGFAIAQDMVALRVDESKMHYAFLLAALRSSDVQSEIKNLDVSGVIPHLKKSDFDKLQVPNPPLGIQRVIGKIYLDFCLKIDLLHRQNKTLEAMAETLFRQWFVEEAKDDWEEVPLREVCQIQNGYAFQSPTYVEQGTRIIRTMNFANHWIELTDLVYISQELARSHEKFYLRRNDFLLVMVGASLGNFALVTNDVLPSLQNQNMWAFRANTIIDQHYLNFAIRQIVNEILFGASGSAREFFQKGVFYELGIRLPPSALLKKFASFAESTFSRIELNRFQLQSLEKLRDNLLPKLMSGEVRVQYE